jgi:hypothetical protein
MVPTAAGAAPVRTIGLTAQVETVEGTVFGTFCGVGPGDTITGSYTYTLDVRDTNPAKFVGDYVYSAPPYGITLNLGEGIVRTDPNSTQFLIEIVDDLPAGDPPGSVPTDNYLLRSSINESIGCPHVNQITWQLDDPTGKALDSASLPPKAPKLAAWQSIFGLTLDGDPFGGFFRVRAHVTSVTTIKSN